MNREQFKLLAAGKYAEMQAQTTGTIDRKEMHLYVEGALFGWDMQQKIQPVYTSKPGEGGVGTHIPGGVLTPQIRGNQ